jgi:hypothetical protein
MRTLTPFRVALTLPALLLSQAAWADLTPAQVWGDWKQYMEGMGYTVTAGEAANGADLTVSDIQMSLKLPEDAGDMSMSMGTLNFVQNGGTVDVVMPDVMPITINAMDGSDQFSMQFEYIQSGQRMNASGTPDNPTYDYSADSIQMSLKGLNADGQAFGPENAKINVTGTGVKSSTTMKIGDLRDYQQTGAFESLVYDVSIDNPEEPVKLQMTGNIAGVSFEGGGAIPLVMDSTDMVAMMKAGFAVAGQFNYTSGATQVQVQDPSSGNFAMNSSSQGGTLEAVMNGKELAYGGTQNDIQFNVQAAQLPFPVEMSMARSGFNLAMPVDASEDPQGFAFGITMGDFVMSDLIWSIFDPTAQLPRDPATLELDLTGQAKMLVSLMDPEAMASTDAPGELQSLTLGKVLLSAAGAKLEGSGDFTFDNSDTTSFPGMPKPVGAINVALAGGNGLMDKLVAMGLLPEEQAMGARMMMGLFAVPGDAPDTLSSKVEFTQDGQVLANGQRIR